MQKYKDELMAKLMATLIDFIDLNKPEMTLEEFANMSYESLEDALLAIDELYKD